MSGAGSSGWGVVSIGGCLFSGSSLGFGVAGLRLNKSICCCIGVSLLLVGLVPGIRRGGPVGEAGINFMPWCGAFVYGDVSVVLVVGLTGRALGQQRGLA